MKIRKNSSSNDARTNARGNAMVYVLIALALLGFLTITLSNQGDQADGQDISDEQAQLYANELISYVASAQQAIDMMIATGTEIDDLNFVNPTSAAFDTPPHFNKVFHPAGGGLNYQEKFDSTIQNGATAQWAINDNINVEWTPTSVLPQGADVILTAYFITRQTCEIINEGITGSTTIPATASPHDEYFLPTGTTNFDTTECAACEGYPSLCVENDSGDNYSFYNIIAAQ